jgi:hypothetical protein
MKGNSDQTTTPNYVWIFITVMTFIIFMSKLFIYVDLCKWKSCDRHDIYLFFFF